MKMAREIKAVVELTRTQMQEFVANLYNPENIKAFEEDNKRVMKIRFHVL